MKNKGFTLIELIAVVVIMGILLLLVFPNVSNIIKGNENKKYENYYDVVQEELELYARTRRDELGGINGNGCVDDAKLSDLGEYEYITEFTEEENVTCKSPGDMTNAELESLGIDTSKQYVNVRIENKKGRINVEYSLICVKEGRSKPEYKKLIEKTKECTNYTPVITNSLINEIKDKINNNVVGDENYVVGNVSNNYVWYSGKMWRIVSFNTTNKTIKLVTDDIMTLMTYGVNNNNYTMSNIENWLNNVFLKTLRNTDKYINYNNWNYSKVSSNVSSPIIDGETKRAKVGLLNNFEYLTGRNYLNIGKKFWLISTTGTNSAWYVNSSGNITSSDVSQFFGVRPSIILKPNITFVYGGDGTINNPYRLAGDTSAEANTYLNTRYAGEYVELNNQLYRISTTDAKYTKLILNSTLNVSRQFHYYDTTYSNNTYIGEYLSTWSSAINDKLVEGDFCRKKILNTDTTIMNCGSSDIINAKIAVPRIGEMFSANSNNDYWTINNAKETVISVQQNDGSYKDETIEKIFVIKNDGTVTEKTIDETSYIRPVIVFKNDVKIVGGDGTANNPYQIN